jgi:signal transduction histidine kinase
MVMTDITARKEAEDALRQAKDQAEEIAQFRSALLQNMTHEIRTPLTVILGFTSMLHQGIRDDYRRFVDLIERSGRRLLLTLDSLLDLAQLESGTLQVDNELHNVFDIVHGTAASLEPMADQKGLTFSLDLPATAAYARFDCELFSHALTHLIDNAIKFTEEGEVAVTAEVADDAVRVHVKDTGVGVGEQFEGRLFDAFSQESEGISRTHQGSGLGLTVAHRLVDRIGGRIEHASRKGQGSVFTIELPVASTEKPHPTEA